MPESVGMAEGPMRQSVMAKAKTRATKHTVRAIEVEKAANGWEVECRFNQPKGMNGSYIEPTKHVFTEAKEANKFLASKLGEMI